MKEITKEQLDIRARNAFLILIGIGILISTIIYFTLGMDAFIKGLLATFINSLLITIAGKMVAKVLIENKSK